MTTHRAIIDTLAQCSGRGEPVVMATVVRVTGSSYGGVGARMVVRVDGSTIGIVSGGCLETDLAEHALQVHETQSAKVVTYDTRADDDAAWGLGLGCNGLIDVLLEPLDASSASSFALLLEDGISGSEPSILVTVIDSPLHRDAPRIGAHALIVGRDVRKMGNWGSGELVSAAAMNTSDALGEGRRGLVRSYGDVTIAFEVVNPVIRLVVCGSGPDVVPLSKLAVDLGWNVTVVDHRAVDRSHHGRFPGAAMVECPAALQLMDVTRLTSSTAAVVMSHHFARDTDYVRALLASPVAYIGLLGPRARAERMLAEIGAQAGAITRGERLFAPVGIDIGADGPDGIALSIIAEVSAVIGGRNAGHLRARRAPLHGSSTTTGSATV